MTSPPPLRSPDQSSEPARAGTADGRNIDVARGLLRGEASGMEIDRPDQSWPLRSAAPTLPVARPPHELTGATYYGMPVIKPPPWKWYIPAYFYVGGVTGAAGILAAAARLERRGELAALARRAQRLAALGSVASAVLLVSDLGRPARFLNMLRVIRPTSPMSLGSWFLSAAGATSVGAVLLARRWPRVAHLLGLLGGVTCAPMTTYTAVLVVNTAVPTWNQARRTLPLLFGASAATGVAALLELAGARTRREHRVVRRMSIAAKSCELAAMHAVERELGDGPAARPLQRDRAGRLWRGAKLLGVASLVATICVRPGRTRRSTRTMQLMAGLLGTAGAVLMRFAVLEAGKAAARDPRVTLAQSDARRPAPGPRTCIDAGRR